MGSTKQIKQKKERKDKKEKREKERIKRKRRFLSRQDIQNVFDEFEFSLSLLEPPLFKVIPIKISIRKKDGRFSGFIVKYKGVIGFIPWQELKTPYCILENAEKLVKDRMPLDVYFQKFKEEKNLLAPWQWQTPIFTMFKPF